MKSNRTSILAALAAASALVLAPACKKEEGAGAGGAPGGGGGAAAALPSGKGFAVFPASTKMVIGANLNQLRSSPLWAVIQAQIQASAAKEFAEVKEVCGFDPFTAVQSVLIGGDPTTEEFVVVVKGIQRAQAKTCLEKGAAKDGKQLTITDDGTFTKYSADGKDTWAAWLDDSTVIIAPEKDKAYVEARAAGTAGLADSAEVMGLLKNVDTGATLYFAATADVAGAQNPIAGMLPGAKAFFGSLRFGDGMDLDTGIRFDTPDNAKNGTTTVQGFMAQAKGSIPPQFASIGKAVEKAQIKQKDSDMIVQLKLSAQDMQEIGTAVQQMGAAFGAAGQ